MHKKHRGEWRLQFWKYGNTNFAHKTDTLVLFYCLFILSALHYSAVCLLRSVDSWLGSGNISRSCSTTEGYIGAVEKTLQVRLNERDCGKNARAQATGDFTRKNNSNIFYFLQEVLCVCVCIVPSLPPTCGECCSYACMLVLQKA